LPDGSNVVLNTNTILNFPTEFEKDVREVSIFGEAFFEVKPDPDKPFIIHASGLEIRFWEHLLMLRHTREVILLKLLLIPARYWFILQAHHLNGRLKPLGNCLPPVKLLLIVKNQVFYKGVNDDLNVLSWKTGVLTLGKPG
jgi:transmembrane sensor